VNPLFQAIAGNNFPIVISPGRIWKQFWDSMERMSDRLEGLIDE
jgi:hypothetical protein